MTDAARDALAAFDPLADAATVGCAPKGLPTIMEQPYSMEFVERFIPNQDGTRMDLGMTVTNPATFQECVVLTKYWVALPGIEVHSYECIE